MKKVGVLIISIGTVFSALSQNLASNPSFEDYTNCPIDYGLIDRVIDWEVTANTDPTQPASPDYFNVCANSGFPGVGIPTNVVGSQEAQEGNAYLGVFCYGLNSAQREYIQTRLTSPLVAGEEYEVSFYVSLPESFGIGIKNMGALITELPIDGNGINPYPADAQIEGSFIITDVLNWTLISGVYQANGGEEYLTIGNFNLDEDTEWVLYNPGALRPYWSYYYIDSVSVTRLLDLNENDLSDQIKLYPNPITENTTIELTKGHNIASIEIYSPIGKLIKTINPNETITMLDLSELAKGVYFLILKDSNVRTFTQRIIKQ